MSQPQCFAFPYSPELELFLCSCWGPYLPAKTQVELILDACITIKVPQVGHIVTCRRCNTTWQRTATDAWAWLPMLTVPMTAVQRRQLYEQSMEGVESEAGLSSESEELA